MVFELQWSFEGTVFITCFLSMHLIFKLQNRQIFLKGLLALPLIYIYYLQKILKIVFQIYKLESNSSKPILWLSTVSNIQNQLQFLPLIKMKYRKARLQRNKLFKSLQLIKCYIKNARKKKYQINLCKENSCERVRKKKVTRKPTYCHEKLPVMPSLRRSRSERCLLGPGPVSGGSVAFSP